MLTRVCDLLSDLRFFYNIVARVIQAIAKAWHRAIAVILTEQAGTVTGVVFKRPYRIINHQSR
jgi:hypothetical protein